MNKSIVSTEKKRGRGRPKTHRKQISVNMNPIELADIDHWITEQSDEPSRPEAIRRILKEKFQSE